MRECLENKQGSGTGGNRAHFPLIAQQDSATPRRAISSTGGGTNHLYALSNSQENENSPDVFNGMIQVFDLTIYTLLDPGASLYFVTPYVPMNFDIVPDKLNEPFSVRHLLVNPY